MECKGGVSSSKTRQGSALCVTQWQSRCEQEKGSRGSTIIITPLHLVQSKLLQCRPCPRHVLQQALPSAQLIQEQLPESNLTSERMSVTHAVPGGFETKPNKPLAVS